MKPEVVAAWRHYVPDATEDEVAALVPLVQRRRSLPHLAVQAYRTGQVDAEAEVALLRAEVELLRAQRAAALSLRIYSQARVRAALGVGEEGGSRAGQCDGCAFCLGGTDGG